MLWTHEGKQLLRTPLRTVAFCLALATVIGLFSITLGLQTATAHAVTAVEDQYTTIGVMKPKPEVSDPLYKALFTQKTLTLTQLKSIQRNSTLLAYEPSLQTVTSAGISDGMVEKYDQPNNLALFAVTCTGQSYLKNTTQIMSTSGSKKTVKVYDYRFRVKEVGHLHAEMPIPQTVSIESGLNLPGGLPIFEEGETYWVCGYYEPGIQSHGVLTLQKERDLQTDLWETSGVIYKNMPLYDTQYRVAMIGTYSGPLEEIKDAEVREMWENMRECLEISTHSLIVRSADDVSGLLPFVTNSTRILQGRVFTEEDIEQENRVVIISEILAENNGLEVGDTLALSFYTSTFNFLAVSMRGDLPYPDNLYGESKQNHKTLLANPEWSASVADGSYTVIGIYSSENGIVDDYQALHPNTVIVPQSAMARHFSINSHALDYTFILPNGGIDAFEAELESHGYGGVMDYDDGGYSVIMPNVKTIRDSAGFVNGIVTALWLIVVLAVLFFFILMQIPAGRVKYRLGTGRRAIWGEMSFSAVLLLVISGAVGCLGSILLYDRALGWMMSTEFTSFNTAFSTQSAHAEMLEQLLTLLGQTPSFFVLAAACQVGVLAVLSVTLSAAVAFRKSGWNR